MEGAPAPGFVIKLRAPCGTRHYVNVCSHPAIDRPIDARDQPVNDEHLNTHGIDNLRVPLLTSPPRILELNSSTGGSAENEALAIDVAFNPAIVSLAMPEGEADSPDNAVRRRVLLGRAVRGRLVELAIKNAEDDLHTKLGREFTLPRSLRYKGGIDSSGEVSEAGQRPLVMPALKQIIQHNAAVAKHQELAAAPGPWRSNHKALGKNTRPAPSIEEVSRQERASAPSGAPSKPAIKKGFFNGAKTSLYPDGSNEGMHPEGAGDPLGWMPKKLRERVGVVDTAKASPEEQRKMIEAHAAGNAPHQAKPAPSAPADSDKTTAEKQPKLPPEVAALVPSPEELKRIAEETNPTEFLSAMQKLDETLKSGPPASALPPASSPSKAIAPPPAASREPKAEAASREPVHSVEELEDDCGLRLRVELPGVPSMSEVTVSISAERFELTAPRPDAPPFKLNFEWPRPIDADNAAARFMKKQQVLRVTVPSALL